MSNKRDLKAYVRFDGTGRIISGSLILQRFKPKVGNWQEIDAYECCNPTTTTTTTVCPINIYLQNNSSQAAVTDLLINGVPITIISGSFPLTQNNNIIATTTQSGLVDVSISIDNVGWYIPGVYYCGGSQSDIGGSSPVVFNEVNLVCGCDGAFSPGYNLAIYVGQD